MVRLPLILLLNGLVLAQGPPEASDPLGDPSPIERGLHSAIPLQVAINASRAVGSTEQRRGQWLRDALTRSLLLQPEAEAVRARRAILDALVRTRTPVPVSELLPFFDQFPAAVIAIVAKNNLPEDEDRLPLLLKAEEGRNSTYWRAAASLMDQKQLAHYLVQQVRFDYVISVLDRDFVPVEIFESPPSGVMGGIPGGMPKGLTAWPEETIYHIEMSGDIDHILTCCIGGITYLEAWPRAVHDFADVQPADPRAWKDHDREVVQILSSIAHCPLCQTYRSDFPNVRGGQASIVWHSLEQARPILEEAVERYVKECVKMIDALHETVSESEIRSKVRVWIRDRRGDQTIPIPSVGAGVEFDRCASANRYCLD